jgi:hypothetical protein
LANLIGDGDFFLEKSPQVPTRVSA